MWACLLLSVFNLKDQIMNYLVCREIKNAMNRLLSHPLCISMSALVACLVAVLCLSFCCFPLALPLCLPLTVSSFGFFTVVYVLRIIVSKSNEKAGREMSERGRGETDIQLAP